MAHGAPTPHRARASHDPERTRRLLIDSALELFGEQGFHGTSVQEIVDRAQVTKGAFYHHFGGKEDVLALIHHELLDLQRAAVERVLAEGGSPADQVRDVIRASVLAVARRRRHVAVFVQERRCLTGERARAVEEKRDAIGAALDAMVRDGIERGQFDPRTHARVAVLGIVGMTAWVHEWFPADGSIPAEQVAEDLVRLALEGLVVRA